MVRRLIIASLLACITFSVNAQQNNDALEMHVKIRGQQEVTNGNGEVITLSGELVFPRNAFEWIKYMKEQLPGLEAVDLGLPSGIKWASMNFYQDPSKSDIGELFPAPVKGDTVQKTWGKDYGHWRMPTLVELYELYDYCDWTWGTNSDGIEGCWISSTINNNKIFLPKTGYDELRKDGKYNHKTSASEYWTTTWDDDYPGDIFYLRFSRNIDEEGGVLREDDSRNVKYLRAIRPVWVENLSLSVDITELTVRKTGTTLIVEISDGDIPDGATCYYIWGDDTNDMNNKSNPMTPESNTIEMVLNEPLLAGNTYYFQAVLELESGEKIESKIESDSIPSTSLEITSNSIKEDDITESTATVSMKFKDGYAYISSYGVLYTSNEGKKDLLIKGMNDADVVVVTQNVNDKLSSPGVTITLTDLLPNTTYYYKCFACMKNELDSIRYSEGVDSFKTQEAEYFEPNDSFPRPQRAVDLGLPSGIKWSPWNMGGKEPTDTGGYYGWGDVTGKVMELNDAFYAGGSKTIADIAGTKYDIATYQWQGQWRMPQRKDFEELYKYCDFRIGKWENKGDNGWIVVNKSKTDSIFIPFAGYKDHVGEEHKIYGKGDVRLCYYWTSEADLVNSANPYRFRFSYSSSYDIESRRRVELYPIRPVFGPINTSTEPEKDPDPVTPPDDGEDQSLKISGYDENHTTAIPADGVDLGLPSGTKWAAWNVGALNYGEMGHYYAFGDSSSVERNQYLESNYNPSDEIDNKPVNFLSASDDIASRLWKGDWRMPTLTEIAELLAYNTTYETDDHGNQITTKVYKYVDFQWCLDSIKDENGNFLKDEYGNVKTHSGYKITSKINGKSIFLPAGGSKTNSVHNDELQGHYWTACGSDAGGKKRTDAWQVYFSEQDKPYTSSLERFIGCLVRPVKSKK